MLIEVLQNQYARSFNILRNVIINYNESIWLNKNDYKTPAWQIVYHAIFYVNIYCSSSEDEIIQWNKSRNDYYDFKKMHDLIKNKGIQLIPYTKSEMIEYLNFVLENIPLYLSKMKPEEKCWPYWYNESQLEFHFNNLRHLQHHTGEIIERHDIKIDLPYVWE
jgi:hypothetical protein